MCASLLQASGALQTETAAINKSLSALGDVMTAIAAKDSHVPYRNSKLTFLLQPALSKGARVMFIVAASPDAVDANETLVSLGFGTRARNAQLGREHSARNLLAGAGGSTTPQATPRGGGGTTPGRAPGASPAAGLLSPGGGGRTLGMSKTPNGLNVAKSPAVGKSPHGALGKRPATPGSQQPVKRGPAVGAN